MNPSPLLEVHRQHVCEGSGATAEFQGYGDVQIVSTFGEPQAEYAAIRKSCGLMDLPQRGVIELSGRDRLSFLNNLVSNQVWDKQTKKPLETGKMVYAFLLDAKTGRIRTDLNVIELGDRTLLEMDVRKVPEVAKALDQYLFGEQVKIVSRAGELHEIGLYGPVSEEIAGTVEGIRWKDDLGCFLILPRERVVEVWKTLLEKFGAAKELGKRALRPVGWAAFNATRIEAGRALFGIDFDESILPAETGNLLERAVSFTKGCYPGQEIVARMHARQQVAKKLVGIRMENDALPIAGTKIMDDAGNEIGGVTSSTVSPVLSNVAICLGLVKRPWFEVGKVVQIPAEGEMRRGTVVQTPFVSDSPR